MNGADRATNGTSVGSESLFATRCRLAGWSCQVTRSHEIDAHRGQHGGGLAVQLQTVDVKPRVIHVVKVDVIKSGKIRMSTVGSRD